MKNTVDFLYRINGLTDNLGNWSWLGSSTIYMAMRNRLSNQGRRQMVLQGIVIGPKKRNLGLHGPSDLDICRVMPCGGHLWVSELRNFMLEAAHGDLDRLQMLWVDAEDVITVNDVGFRLRQARDLFLSKENCHDILKDLTEEFDQLDQSLVCGERAITQNVLAAEEIIRSLRIVESISFGTGEIVSIANNHEYCQGQDPKELFDKLVRSVTERVFESSLPDEIDYDKLSDLCVELVELEYQKGDIQQTELQAAKKVVDDLLDGYIHPNATPLEKQIPWKLVPCEPTPESTPKTVPWVVPAPTPWVTPSPWGVPVSPTIPWWEAPREPYWLKNPVWNKEIVTTTDTAPNFVRSDT